MSHMRESKNGHTAAKSQLLTPSASEEGLDVARGTAVMPVNKSGPAQQSPVRTSTRKVSSTCRSTTTASTAAATTALPTPLSMSPTRSTASFQPTRLPPSFDPHHTSSRYPASTHTPFSPYRPGEYGRSERGLASERTKIERRLFGDDEDDALGGGGKRKDEVGSSPLAPAFEAKMVLRNGASVDLISWLRTNFHHIPEHQHNSLTPSMSLIGIRALLLERFPRVPDLTELSKAVLAAFPRSRWEASQGAFSNAEPPTLRGLVWHGKDVADEDDEEEDEEDLALERQRQRQRQREKEREKDKDREKERETLPQIITRARASGKGKMSHSASRSPTQSTLVSPTSSSARKAPPDTPARSVLEEFAEIATLADKPPVSKTQSLPGDPVARSPAYALATICNSFDGDPAEPAESTGPMKKRRASQSPDARRRATTPDKLHGLLAAAEAVEGSPITSVLGHKRRRTIGGPGTMRDVLNTGHKRGKMTRGTVSPVMGGGLSFFTNLNEGVDGEVTDLLVPLNDTASAISLTDLDAVSLAARSRPPAPRTGTSSSASQTSNISSTIPTSDYPYGTTSHPNPVNPGGSGGRRANELPTQGDNPGVDCKPPHPYHEMIRHAIESAPDNRLQLSQIYNGIADRFPFFKTLDEKKTAGWQNSIRHNLSLKKMFVRVNKVDGIPDDTGGKGGWWTVQPGVPDEGRPGRKAKSKKPRHSGETVESILDEKERSMAPSINGVGLMDESVVDGLGISWMGRFNGTTGLGMRIRRGMGGMEMGAGNALGMDMDMDVKRSSTSTSTSTSSRKEKGGKPADGLDARVVQGR